MIIFFGIIILMTTLATIFAGILGTIIGSFLNVVILRYGTGKTVGGRSGCMTCGYRLRGIDMIPVLSWLFLRGKCRTCHYKISKQYPLVELGTGILFALLFSYSMGYTVITSIAAAVFVWNAIIFSILIVIFVYDLRHKIIPDGLVFIFIGMSLAQTLYHLPIGFWGETLPMLNLFAGPILALPFLLIWIFSKGRLIGFGDLKLMLGIGWFLGLAVGLTAIFFAFWIGALFAVIFMLISNLNSQRKGITMKTEIPFAPFLIVGAILQFFLALDLVGVTMFF